MNIGYIKSRAVLQDEAAYQAKIKELNVVVLFADKQGETADLRDLLKYARSGDNVIVEDIKHLSKTAGEFIELAAELSSRNITIICKTQKVVGDVEPAENDVLLIETIDSKTWKNHGDAMLSDVAKAIGVTHPSEEYDTFNGLIFGSLRTIPQDGTTAELETAGLMIKVTDIRNYQVKTAVVCLENPLSGKEEGRTSVEQNLFKSTE